MKFAKKCPKCGGQVQTKNLRKSIGLGFVDIPVAQFCLNPACDWYQDFSEAAKAEEIKEDTIQIKIPSLKERIPEIKKRLPKDIQVLLSQKETQKNLLRLGGIIFLCIILIFLIPLIMHPSAPSQNAAPGVDNPPAITPQVSSPTPTATPVGSMIYEPKTYPIKMDVKNGFIPPVKTINRSDIVVWDNWEDQRPRIILISIDGLFGNQLMQSGDRFIYQFNQSGKYRFVLAEYNSLNEYPNATGTIIVS